MAGPWVHHPGLRHLTEHDVHHGAGISLILGSDGLGGLDL
jgi:hypothetical protein